MTTRSNGPEPHEEELRVAGALYSALMAARPYVKRAAEAKVLGEPMSGARRASVVLEDVDGALADAGELLPRVTP